MKTLLALVLSIFSLTAFGQYFIESTSTSVKVKRGLVSEFIVDGEVQELNDFEKLIIARSQSRCGRMGSIEGESCTLYYEVRSNIIIRSKGYVVRDHKKFLLDEAELGTLQKHRACQNFLWTIDAQDSSTFSDEMKTKIEDKRSMCRDFADSWKKIKEEGGREHPDVIHNQDPSIWDQAKNFFFGEETSIPAGTEVNDAAKSN